MRPLFEPNLIYPSDGCGGPYVELEGEVTLVEGLHIIARTEEHGERSGYAGELFENRQHLLPKPGDLVTLRLHNWGGGWYPEDHASGWTPKAAIPNVEELHTELKRLLHWSTFRFEDHTPFGFRLVIAMSEEVWKFRGRDLSLLLLMLREIPQEPMQERIESTMQLLRRQRRG